MSEHMQDYEMTEKQVRPTFGKGLVFLLVLLIIAAVLGFFVSGYMTLDIARAAGALITLADRR